MYGCLQFVLRGLLHVGLVLWNQPPPGVLRQIMSPVYFRVECFPNTSSLSKVSRRAVSTFHPTEPWTVGGAGKRMVDTTFASSCGLFQSPCTETTVPCRFSVRRGFYPTVVPHGRGRGGNLHHTLLVINRRCSVDGKSLPLNLISPTRIRPEIGSLS